MNQIPKCGECRKPRNLWDGCSRVICSKRRPYSAVIVPDAQISADTVRDGFAPDAYMKIPTNQD